MVRGQSAAGSRGMQSGSHSPISGAIIFLLLTGFAMLAMLVVAVGARVYRSVDAVANHNFNARTALSYVAGKVRSCDAADCVTTFTQQDGSAVLMLSESVEGRDYCTYIFCRDGELYEYFGLRARGFDAGLGEKLVAVTSFDVTKNDAGLLTIRIIDDTGDMHTLTLYVQSLGGGAA